MRTDLKDINGKKNYASISDPVGSLFKVNDHADQKYGCTDSWTYREDPVDGINIYFNAMIRHIKAHLEGEMEDPESGLDHIDHALWNVLAVAEFYKRML